MATKTEVAKLYVSCFDRAPDADGLKFWMDTGWSLDALAKEWFSGNYPEVTGKYPAGQDAATFINTIYMNVLGRGAEGSATDPTTGLGFWVKALNDGSISRDTAVLEIMRGATGSDATRLENLADVGLYWTANSEDSNPDAYEVLDPVTADKQSVSDCKDWVDNVIDSDPRYYHEINNAKGDFTKTSTPGAAQDDVFLIKKFHSADLFGDAGSDTLDFQKWGGTGGVKANLSTGTMTGFNADGTATGMTFSWMENIRGTAEDDLLSGNSDANILISQGVGTAGDTVDGNVGDDRIIFNTIADIDKSIINGGQNNDTLEIVREADIVVKASGGVADFDKVSDVENLRIGYKKGDGNGVATAATVTMENNATFGTIQNLYLDAPTVMTFQGNANLDGLKSIVATEGATKNGKPVDDIIQTAGNLTALTVALTGIDELKVTADDKFIKVGKDTLASVDKVTGFATGTTTPNDGTLLSLIAKDGDVIDLTKPVFSLIDIVNHDADDTTAGLQAAASTIIVNQSLIQSLASTAGTDGFATGNFTKSTLQASGIGMDLSVLADGDTNFKAINFGTAHEVTVGNINNSIAGVTPANPDDLTALRSITGSVNDSDLLRIKPNAVVFQDLAGAGGKDTDGTSKAIAITNVERLDFEEIQTVAMDNLNLGKVDGKNTVYQISGDDDKLNIGNDTFDTNDNGTVIDAGYETDKGGLDLSGIKLQNIAGLGDNVSGNDGTVTINHATSWDADFKSLDGGKDILGVPDLGTINPGETASKQTIIASDAGSYDLSQIATADRAIVILENLDITNDISGNGYMDANKVTVQFNDLFIGSTGDDIVKGAKTGMGYQLGDGNDNFVGQNTANEVVEGGKGNDVIALGDNLQVDNDAAASVERVIYNYTNLLGVAASPLSPSIPAANTGLDVAESTVHGYDGDGTDIALVSKDATGPFLGNTFDTQRFAENVDLAAAVGPNGGWVQTPPAGATPARVLGNGTVTAGIDALNAANGRATPFVRAFDSTGSTSAFVDNATKSNYIADDFDGRGAYANGGDGDDSITSGKGNDVLFGGAGKDFISGGAGADILVGEAGNDTLSGGLGNDILIGGSEDDVLEGNEGDDFFYGGTGMDTFRGGSSVAPIGSTDFTGQDHFHFAPTDSGSTPETVDRITDFLSYSRALDELKASKTDINADGVVDGADAAEIHDVIYLDWYADDGITPQLATLNKAGTLLIPNDALDISSANPQLVTGAPLQVNADGVPTLGGQSYDAYFDNYDSAFTNAASLVDAANAAFDKSYIRHDLASVLSNGPSQNFTQAPDADALNADYTAIAVQFEYGGHEYLAINAYVDGGQLVNTPDADAFNPTQDLIIELSSTTQNWALTSDRDGAVEVIVTRWDTALAGI